MYTQHIPNGPPNKQIWKKWVLIVQPKIFCLMRVLLLTRGTVFESFEGNIQAGLPERNNLRGRSDLHWIGSGKGGPKCIFVLPSVFLLSLPLLLTRGGGGECGCHLSLTTAAAMIELPAHLGTPTHAWGAGSHIQWLVGARQATEDDVLGSISPASALMNRAVPPIVCSITSQV